MGLYWFLIILPSLFVVILTRVIWPKEITMKEWGLQFIGLFLTTAFCLGCLLIGKFAQLSDFDILNGYVISKYSEMVPCEHTYQCGETCSGSGKRRSCQPIICHRHAYDVDWIVHTSVGDSEIDRVDEQGIDAPPRWLVAKVDELATKEEHVTSYLMVDKDRFKTTDSIREKYKNVVLPDYPDVTDYYRFNRIVNETGNDYSSIRQYLDNALKTDGKKYQLNITVLVTKRDEDYFNLINEHWEGVRKNDVVLAYGIDDDNNIRWFHAMTYGDGQGNREMISYLSTLAQGQMLNLDLVKRQYAEILKDYHRLPASTFKYLSNDYEPPMWLIVIFVFVNIAMSSAIAYYMREYDVV